MKNKKILGLMLTGIILANVMPQVSLAANDYNVKRIQGMNRYETSVKISNSSFEKSDRVILVSGENFADALTAGNLSAEGPILLTEKEGLKAVTSNEIERLKAKEVIIVGGESSVSKKIEGQLKGKKIIRISGKNRYETSTKLAQQLKAKDVVLANGNSFADALSAAPFAVQKNQTLVLTDGKNLPDGIKAEDVKTIIGGKNSVNIKGLEKAERVSGKNRYETSLEVMKRMNKTEKAVLADGRNYPDALSAAPLAVKKSTGILLSDDNAIDNIKSFIDKNGIKQVTIIGGEKSVSKTQFEKLTGEYKHQSEKEDTNSKKDPEKVAPNDVEKTKSEIGRDLDLSKFDINTPLSQREKELANLVNEYRKSKGLKPLKISKSLTFVARTHNNDQNLYYNENWKDKRGLPANLHSWSNKGKWTPVMYTSDHKYAEGMWNKPSELTDFKVDGFEISAEGYFEADESAEFALKMWKESEGHNAVLTGKGNWNSLSVMGVSINGDHADIWFADETNDPAGFFKLK
ncbi:MAG: cell wall-binding repeat-containing protein [Finegoldia magna]|nr:cell wall-binding repeat-containing protein [Finegoldia magna]